MDEHEPSEAILAAKRALDGVSGLTQLGAWQWHDGLNRWSLRCCLEIMSTKPSLVPHATEWYIVVSDLYPWGSIKLYPAKANGLQSTFPHQRYNGLGKATLPWRDGDICVQTSVHTLGRHGYDIEPFTPHERLAWHCTRAIDWLDHAAKEQLAQNGDPYELPDYPTEGPAFTVTTGEGDDGGSSWTGVSETFGMAELVWLRTDPGRLIVRTFGRLDGQVLRSVKWGSHIAAIADRHIERALWIRLPTLPILSPYQAPMTWGELATACGDMKVDVLEILRSAAPKLRDDRQHFLLLGGMIPRQYGQPAVRMAWLPILLPCLSCGPTTAKGFRTNEQGYWQRDRAELLGRNKPVRWQHFENWHEDDLSSRGAFSPQLKSSSVLVVGAGAVGSAVAELLVRGGVRNVMIVDGEDLKGGNLVRHTLLLADVDQNKALGVAKRLALANPHSCIKGFEYQLGRLPGSAFAQVQQCSCIVDCTGSDGVLHQLSTLPWGTSKLFCSISTGFRAERLFLFMARGAAFPHAEFIEKMHKWLVLEQEEFAKEKFPREGVGCWHPVFPARTDDIWLCASIATKHLDAHVADAVPTGALTVFEQQYDGSGPCGVIKRATE